MNRSPIQNAIKKSNIWLAVLAILSFIVAALAFAANFHYFESFFAGPFKVSSAQLASYNKESDYADYWVTTPVEETYYTGIYQTESKSGSTVHTSSYHVALLDNGYYMIIKYPGSYEEDKLSPQELTGKLEKFTPDEVSYIMDDLRQQDPEMAEITLPYKLTILPGSYRSNFLPLLLLLVSFGLAVFFFVKLVLRLVQPQQHPIIQDLNRFGDFDSVKTLVEQEMAAVTDKPTKGVVLTENFLVQASGPYFKALPYESLVWIYMNVVRNRYAGVVTVSKTHAVYVYDRSGKLNIFAQGAKEDACLDLLNRIYERAPWVYAGYSEELNTLWRKQRQVVLDGVAERRQAIVTGTSPVPEALEPEIERAQETITEEESQPQADPQA